MAKQQRLEGVIDSIPELDSLIDQLKDVQDQRMDLTKQEKELRVMVGGALHRHELTEYVYVDDDGKRREAFIEEGEPIPTDPRERFESGVLGEYGLYFGDGFLIHGTLYERLLGRNVTHGCIRLGRGDLRVVQVGPPGSHAPAWGPNPTAAGEDEE